MRAILLVKDKEGLNEDRLQNSRYGLTGKPTLAQQGIAGSLSASFKAGQQVTVSNLRSLNDKLREAQKALDNANNNIDQVDQTQDKMDDAKDEVNRLLSTGLWEKLWNGTITPFEFYAGKYAEDTSNEAMAGEPGFPVQNIGEVMSAPPIPRLQYWDPFLIYNEASTILYDHELRWVQHSDRVVRDSDVGLWSNIEKQTNTISTLAGVCLGLIVSCVSLIIPIIPVASWMAAIEVKVASSDLPMMAAILAISVAFNVAFSNVINGKAKAFNAYSNNTPPFLYAVGSTNYRSALRSDFYNVFNTISTINLSLAVSLYSAAAGVLTAANACLPGIPFTIPAINALAGTAAGFLSAVLAHVVIQLVTLGMAMVTFYAAGYTRNIDGYYDKRISAASCGDFDGYNNTLKYYDDKLDIISTNAKVASIIATSGIAAIASLAFGDDSGFSSKCDVTCRYSYDRNTLKTSLDINADGNVTYDGTSPSLPFSSWWEAPLVNVNINDAADGTTIGHPIQQPTYVNTMRPRCQFKSQVFRGDYFGTQRAIKILEGRTITNTVVVRARHTIENYIYYACGVLVTTNTTGNQLHLLWERNAVYDFNENTSMPQVEQMIYNYEPSALPVKDFFTNNRTGRLQYVYGKFKTGKGESTFQLRNVQRAWPNYLNGQLINTEYTFGPMTVLSSGPRCTWGGLSSYMYL